MKILAIDTSTMISSCSLMEDGLIVGDYNINQKKLTAKLWFDD